MFHLRRQNIRRNHQSSYVPKHIVLIYIIFTLFTLLNTTAFAQYTVRVIYFVPQDRQFQWDISQELHTKMKKVQQFYADEMERHNYGRKTFKLDTNANDTLIIHPIWGQHNDTHYHTDTINKINLETKDRFDATDIRVIIVNVSTERVQGNCGIARYNGGPVLVPASGDCVTGEQGVDLIAHELGHALNLQHDFRDDSFIMSYGADRNKLSQCAATMLNVSPYFNNVSNTAENTGASIQMLTPITYPKNAQNWTLRFNISDSEGIYQVQFLLSVPNGPASIVECKKLSGETQPTEVEFIIPTDATLLPANIVYVRTIDNNGYVSNRNWELRIESTTTEEPTEINDTNITETYLTLTYDNPGSLVPTNSPNEWSRWGPNSHHIWEKTPDGLVPRRPTVWFMDPEKSTQFYDYWDHFFYAHAPSRIIYDLSKGDYEKFEFYFDMPNPCGSVASIEVIFKADNVEIYNSGLIRGYNTRNIPMSINIPQDTKELEIIINDGYDDNGCDHFIFGNPRLIHRKTTTPTITTTTTESQNTDVNGDGITNVLDLIIVATNFRAQRFNPNADINGDGVVNGDDIRIVLEELETQAAPTKLTLQTRLLPNYPNPFNPETWIPYQLSEPSDVSITIYNTKGHIIRKLELGHQEAGRYITQEQAAYWDGTNRFGEKVSSGLYYYTITAGKFSATRKMLILK